MNGVVLILGVISASASVLALAGGLTMLFLSMWVDSGSTVEKDHATTFFVVVGCFYLGISALLAFWVPAVCWIFIGAIALVLGFLAAVIISLGEDGEESCVS